MSDFNNIKKYFPGIQVWAKPYKDNQMVIYAEELETILQSAQVVYGTNEYRPDEYEWSKNKLDSDTHCALLLAITPIKKKTKAEAALEFVRSVSLAERICSGSYVKEAKRILDMKDEV